MGQTCRALIFQHFGHQSHQIHRRQTQHRLATVEPGNIQHVVHMVHEQPARCRHDPDIFALVRGQIGAVQQINRADHAVQRGSDLVAHHHQQVGLGLLTGQSLVAGIDQRLLGRHLARKVAQKDHMHRPVSRPCRGEGNLRRETMAILVSRGNPQAAQACGQGVVHRRKLGAALRVGRHQQPQIAAHHHRTRIAKGQAGRRVEIHDPARVIQRDHRIARGCHHRIQPRQGAGILDGPLPVAPVQPQHHGQHRQQRRHQDHGQRGQENERTFHPGPVLVRQSGKNHDAGQSNRVGGGQQRARLRP